MNIVLINHYAGSKSHGMEYRPYYLAREWVRQGHQVTVVAASFSHLRVENPKVSATLTEEQIEGIRYVWLKTPGYQGNTARRVVNLFWFTFQLYRAGSRLARLCRPEVVIASSPHPLIARPACRLARKSGARFVFEVRDLWPLTLLELSDMSPRHPFIMLLQRAENYAYRKADRVVSVLPKADRYMREHGMAAEKFAYLPNGIAVAEWDEAKVPAPPEHAEALAALKDRGRFLVGYVGQHGVGNALGTAVEAAGRLQDRPVTLVFVGQGPEKEGLRKKAQDMGLANAIFLPAVAKAAVPSLLDAMDALYIGWARSPLYSFGISPNKLMDYMMAARPVVHSVDAANDPVAESGCGISCAPEDPEAIARAIGQLMDSSAAQREAMGRRGRDYVMRHHDYAVLARQFADIMA